MNHFLYVFFVFLFLSLIEQVKPFINSFSPVKKTFKVASQNEKKAKKNQEESSNNSKKTKEQQKESLEDKSSYQVSSLEELLQKVKKDQVENSPELRRREELFLKARSQQKALLLKANQDLQEEEKRLVLLQNQFEKNDQDLKQLEDKLALVIGALGELFGVVKQSSGELRSLFMNSVISAEYPGRHKFIKKINDKKNLPDTQDLEKLWFLMQQEMTESGQVTRFKQELVFADGESREEELIRIGSFNLISKGKYFVFDSDTQRVVELVKQPRRRFLSLAKKLEKASKDSIYKFGIDPSRGSLLSLLIQTPSPLERLAQGGFVGYLIVFLLLCGLFLCGKKYWYLFHQEKLLNLQKQSKQTLKNNPLGEIMQTFVNFKEEKQDILELKMEEAILQQSSSTKKGLGTIKLLSSLAPLLGLLGTVIGMITTFQSITLFGTGDPKLMAGGISQALVTTALGLVVAIPLIFIHNFLLIKANRLIQIFEEESLGLLSRKYNKSQ
ncbi:MAG: MotA/TolQ/ExbB proton channel family protein [Bdellovibrionales bacterium]|nr:MotA/TolQ/ExbB proton channel family protein [Bdellovibrionales bacterium]